MVTFFSWGMQDKMKRAHINMLYGPKPVYITAFQSSAIEYWNVSVMLIQCIIELYFCWFSNGMGEWYVHNPWHLPICKIILWFSKAFRQISNTFDAKMDTPHTFHRIVFLPRIGSPLSRLPSVAYTLYAAVNWVSIGSGNGLPPVRRQVEAYCLLDPSKENSVKFESKYKIFHSRKCIRMCRLWNGGHFVQGDMS